MFESSPSTSTSWIWRLYTIILKLLTFGSTSYNEFDDDYDFDSESDFQDNPFCTVQQGPRGSFCSCRFPIPDVQDTYNLASIIRYQGFNFRPIRLSAGETIVVTNKIGCVEDNDLSTNEDRNELFLARARQVKVECSKQWFTLVDSEINQDGELVQRFVTERGRRTPAGRVVMVDVRVLDDEWYGEKDGVIGMDRSMKFFYQFT